jgi:hypothetical protein
MKLQPIDDLVDDLALGAHPTKLRSARVTALTASRLAASCAVLNMSSVQTAGVTSRANARSSARVSCGRSAP